MFAIKLTLRVISCLRGKPLPMVLLYKLPKVGEIIGKNGHITAHSAMSLPTLKIYIPVNA